MKEFYEIKSAMGIKLAGDARREEKHVKVRKGNCPRMDGPTDRQTEKVTRTDRVAFKQSMQRGITEAPRVDD